MMGATNRCGYKTERWMWMGRVFVHGSQRDGILQGKGGDQSGGHAEGLSLTGVVGG